MSSKLHWMICAAVVHWQILGHISQKDNSLVFLLDIKTHNVKNIGPVFFKITLMHSSLEPSPIFPINPCPFSAFLLL